MEGYLQVVTTIDGEEKAHTLESLVKQNHPYETPEIIALPVSTGNQDYLEWIKAETTL
jgi:periplasmic divalent cation tolerance protein